MAPVTETPIHTTAFRWRLGIAILSALAAAMVSILWVGRLEQERDITHLEALLDAETALVDMQLSAYSAALLTIARSDAVAGRTDVTALRREAQRLGDLFGGWFVLSRSGPSLDIIMQTRTEGPPPTPIPRSAVPQIVAAEQRATLTGQPAVSDAFMGQVAGEHVVTLAVAVPQPSPYAHGRFLYMSFDTQHLSDLLVGGDMPRDHVSTIVDGSQRIIARSSAMDQYRMASLPAALEDAAATDSTTVLIGAELDPGDGRRIVAMRRLAMAPNWTLLVSAPYRPVFLMGLRSIWPVLSVLATVLVLLGADRVRHRYQMQRMARQAAEAEAHEKSQLLEALRVAQTRQTKLIGVVGHELRTPLLAQLAVLDLLATGAIDRGGNSLLDRAKRDAQDMLDLLDDLLDIARIGTGEVQLSWKPLDPVALLHDAADILRPIAKRNGNKVGVKIEGTPGPVLGDAAALRRILLNFGSNAAKFTQDGKITLALASRPLSGNRVELTLSVTDTGIGIAAADQAGLFEEFARLDSARTLDPGGTGLGLAICRGLAEAMGGEVTVDSAPGSGSTFRARVILPQATEKSQPEPEQDETDLHGLRILIAEDQEIIRRVTARTLEARGARIVAVADGREAVAEAEHARFDLILLDLRMPGLDGVSAARMIRDGQGPNARTPILGVTAQKGPETAALLAKGVFTACLTKPVEAAALPFYLAAALGRGQKPADHRPYGQTLVDSEAVDWLVESPDFASRLFGNLRSESETVLNALSRARSAEEFIALAEDVHRLSGLAKICGAVALGDALDHIDRAAQAGETAAIAEATALARRLAAQTQAALAARVGPDGA